MGLDRPLEPLTALQGFRDRIAVDAPGRDLLSPASLQSFVYAYHQRISFGHERLYQQPQEHAAGLPTRPASTAQDSVVAMEALLLVLSWSKPIARKAELTVRRPAARIAPVKSSWACCQMRLERSGAKGASTCTILGGRVRILITAFSGDR